MYIYKITNKLNGLCYIGQSGDVFERWRQHCSRKNRTLGQAIEKDGIENFIFEIVEKVESIQADERERYWIAYYQSYPNGYNSNAGPIIKPKKQTWNNQVVTNNHLSHAVVALDPKTGELVHYFNSIKEAQIFCKCGNSGNISAVCRGRGRTAYGYIWKYAENFE